MNKKIDLLKFIPKQTSLGYKVLYELLKMIMSNGLMFGMIRRKQSTDL
jgi:hypothetical protein